MATHPEALTATFPTLLLLLLASRMSWGLRAAAAAAAALTPAAIWIATYGARSREAVTEMGRILLHNTPPAGVLSLARDFFLETHRNKGEGMRATLFFLCLLVLEIALLRWATLERFAWKQSHELRPRAAERLLIARIFGISTVLTLVLLIWCLSASVTRYEVIFPVYLVGIAMTLRGFPATRLVSVSTKIVGGALTLTQFLAIAVYLHRDPSSSNLPSANRFDAVLKQIPPGMTVATTPMLWLAFQHEGRPITLLYRGFDGIDTWRAHGGNPLRQFDAVVLDTSFQGEYEDYSPYAAAQRVKHSYNCAGDQVDLYLPAAP